MFTKKTFFILTLLLALYNTVSKAQQEEAALTYINPESGSKIERFSNGGEITFTTNFDADCGGFNVALVDQYRKEHGMADYIAYNTFISKKNAEDKWVVKFYKDITLLKDHVYALEIEGHEDADINSPVVAIVKAFYTGVTENFTYSDAVITNFTPEEGYEYTDAKSNYFFITYNKEVNIDTEKSFVAGSDGTKMPFEYIGNPYYEEKGKTIWQMNIPKNILNAATGEIKLYIYATDLDGLTVKGNVGIEADSHQEISYKCVLGYPQITVYPAGGNIDRLETFSLSCDGGIVIKDETKNISLYNSDRTTLIQSFSYTDLKIPEEDNSILRAQLQEAITKQGEYILVVPEGMFTLGTQQVDNKAMEVKYSIVDRMEQYGVDITPADNSIVKSLSKFIITLNKWDAAVPYYHNAQKITLTDKEGNTVTEAKASIDENRDKNNQCIITLNKEITAPGTYRLNIPYKAFIVDHTGNYYSPEMYFEYTIEETSQDELNFIVETTSGYDGSLAKISVTFNDFRSVEVWDRNKKVEITDTEGNVVSEAIVDNGNTYQKIFIAPQSGSISQQGTYYIHIPANTLKLDSKIYQYDLTVEFVFDTASSIQSIKGSNGTEKFYTIDGKFACEGTLTDISGRLKGIYIVKGKKINIK